MESVYYLCVAVSVYHMYQFAFYQVKTSNIKVLIKIKIAISRFPEKFHWDLRRGNVRSCYSGFSLSMLILSSNLWCIACACWFSLTLMLCAVACFSVFGCLDPEMHRIIEKQENKINQLQKTVNELVSMKEFDLYLVSSILFYFSNNNMRPHFT